MTSHDRSYDHRGGKSNEAFGHIGDVVFEVPDGDWIMRWKATDQEDWQSCTLPESSVIALLDHAGQKQQDAYASAKTRAEAIGKFLEMNEKLRDGTLGVRSNAGVSLDDVAVRARKLAKSDITRTLLTTIGKEKAKVEELAKSDAGRKYFNERDSGGWVWVEKEVEAFIERNIESRDYRADAKAEIEKEKSLTSTLTI